MKSLNAFSLQLFTCDFLVIAHIGYVTLILLYFALKVVAFKKSNFQFSL